MFFKEAADWFSNWNDVIYKVVVIVYSYPENHSDMYQNIRNPIPGQVAFMHDDAIKQKYFPRYWPFVQGIHRSPVNSPHKGQWRGALMFSLICAWTSGWANNRNAGDLGRHRALYYVIVMMNLCQPKWQQSVSYHIQSQTPETASH